MPSPLPLTLKRRLALQSSQIASWLRGNPAFELAHRSKPAPPRHHLVLYDYEASPWCRLVREYLTILDLTAHIRPCPRETLWREGAYTNKSRFRPEAMAVLKEHLQTNDLMFPILVDQTDPSNVVAVQESYHILDHLWTYYGGSVLPGKKQQGRRRDQQVNASEIPFPLRFLFLAAPSYLRPWPRCGVLRSENTTWDTTNEDELVLYQSEGCYASRLVRERLCSLEIPYKSVPVALGSSNRIPAYSSVDVDRPVQHDTVPVLIDGDTARIQGHELCLDYLQDHYEDNSKKKMMKHTTWLDSISEKENLGHSKNNSLLEGAYWAFLKGRRSFVPPRVFD